MRVLVTGASGYVGHAVLPALLEAGHVAVAMVRSPWPDAPAGLEVRLADLTDPAAVSAAVRGCDGVIHLAALSRPRESVAHPVQYYRANVGGTLALLDALAGEVAAGAEPQRFVLASTAAVYAPVELLSEESPTAAPNPYADSKLAAENAARWQARTGAIGSAVARIFNVAGAVDEHGDRDDTRILPRAVAVANGRIDRIDVNGDGSAVRDFVHVRDVATALVAMLERCAVGEQSTYNLGATAASVSDIVGAVERVTGRPVPVNHRPASPHEVSELRADTARAGSELGWTPKHSTLDELVKDQWAAELVR